MDLIPKDLSPVWLCRVCGKGHLNVEDAKACEASTEKPKAKVGDLVLMELGYGWWGGLDDWVVPHGGYEFHGTKTHAFWHVITAIDRGQERPRALVGNWNCHRLTYHMATLALVKQGTGGWTRPATHKWFRASRRQPPQSVIDAAPGLIGKTFQHLL